MHCIFHIIQQTHPLHHVTADLLAKLPLGPLRHPLFDFVLWQNQLVFLRLCRHLLGQLTLRIQRRLHVFHRPMHRLNNHFLWHFLCPRFHHHYLTILTGHHQIKGRLLPLLRSEKSLKFPVHPTDTKASHRPIKRHTRVHQSSRSRNHRYHIRTETRIHRKHRRHHLHFLAITLRE